jgi:hypothetical protein
VSLFALCDIFDGSDIVEAQNRGAQNRNLALLISFIVLGILVKLLRKKWVSLIV